MTFDYGVFIGRFQPFHQGHLHNIKHGLAYCQKLIILIGSAYRSRSIKNPFTFEERQKMIRNDLQCVYPEWAKRIIIEPLQDWLYHETAWENEVKARVSKHTNSQSQIAIIGHQKDHSTYYLECFPEWSWLHVSKYEGFDATHLRLQLFKSQKLESPDYYLVQPLVKDNANSPSTGYTQRFLQWFMTTQTYADLCEEYRYIKHYRQMWRDAPFPPIFVTGDAIVLAHDHILLIKRQNPPGKGLWAMPGGFLDVEEKIIDCIVRELREETAINMTQHQLLNQLVKVEVFDYPERSLRGRVITHVGLLKLNHLETLPQIQGKDDACGAYWVPLNDFWSMPDQMMEDHYQIIQTMLDD